MYQSRKYLTQLVIHAVCMWIEWRDKFTAALNEIAPRVTHTTKKHKSHCPWMTPELHKIHKQKRLYRKVFRTNHQDLNAIIKHRKLRNYTSNLHRKLKHEYFQNCFSQYRKSPTQLWSAKNHVTGRQRQDLPISACVTDLAAHFQSLFTDHSRTGQIHCGPANELSLTEFKPETAGMVKRLLKDLVPTKAPGPDDITPSELKMVAGKISSTVSILFKESLFIRSASNSVQNGQAFSPVKTWKKDTSLPSNHRGISLTCILSKVMEKIVHEQVTDYLTECGALSEDQYGFRKGRSSSDLLLTAVDDWCLAKDAKQYTAVALVDLSKAFDCVRHDLLLQTLQSHGLGGTVLKWLHHYLTDRQQCIMLQDSPLTFNCSKGVPQGSVLGPLLFNLYVSDIGRIAKKTQSFTTIVCWWLHPVCFTSYTGGSFQGRFGDTHQAEGRIRRPWTCYQLRKKQLLCSSLPTRIWQLHL